jgi:hypothetical protein
MVSLQYSAEVLLIGKAILIAILGVFLGFISKIIIKKAVDKGILKKLFKDAHTYGTVSMINTIFAEALQWIIIVGFVNYSLTMLGFNFLSIGLEYIITNIPRIAGFAFIISAGFIISKLITARIQEQNIENKNEITTLTEIIIIAAFFLTSLEFIGITATALVELYKVILYIIGAILIIVKPNIFENKSSKKKK